jgi:valyl-tRNA synthetase
MARSTLVAGDTLAMLEKTYTPGSVEARMYERWEEAQAFEASTDNPGEPFTVMMPPPNVTGSLHIGHALNMTLQDVLTRYCRMTGRNALWQPGMDHAGIATQMVVERQLREEGVDRRDLGREKFVERVWRWREESGGQIINQLRHLGASPDWRRERFTLDEGLSDAVRTVFVRLHKDGLIYRDKRLVNWDCQLLTAISDLEVVQQEIKGHLWHFRYPIEDADGNPSSDYVTVATTRPETMLGDTAVAVHPDDERYTDLIGRNVILPLVGRRIPIVADAYSDPEKGTGAVKITPGHDFNDFEVGKRHDLEAINILDRHGCLNDAVPEAYRGLDRAEARKRVVADIEAADMLDRTEDHLHTVPHGDRSNTVIEPWLTDQWYVDAAVLAKPAIEAVEQGRIRFVPKNWENTYFEWMRNIQPWCISRQLWWGHQIPAWYGPDGHIFVAMDEDEAAAQAALHYGEAVELERDPDVLDTWFSSGLWPFSTLGWPEETPELQTYYPGSVLITGFDIIFFWVARMIMLGLHFMDDVPFRDVYIHALVRDEKGQKMSKSKGNVIDPLVLMEEYGTDALRFTLVAMAAQGRDIKLSEQRVAGYRNFITKLWNAARFCEMNECRVPEGFDPAACKGVMNRWIVSGCVDAARDVAESIEAYQFNDAANATYRFVWNTFCDWYLELAKPVLYGDDGAEKDETRATAAWVLEQVLAIMHPVAPFVTEELYGAMGARGDALLMESSWPDFDDSLVDNVAKAEIDWLVRLIGEVRSVRAEMNVPAGAKVPLTFADAGVDLTARFERHKESVETLARVVVSVADSSDSAEVRAGAIQIVFEESSILLKIADLIDITEERARLERERGKMQGEIAKIDKKLGNEKFLARAPEAVVEEQRERRSEADLSCRKLDEAIGRLSSL